ncbi:hypothetical protein CB0940_05506 [Cercospora beticola]|uniref:Uncharacterized protein n=1 Tax=Cercospora beticola TaxID=122368 RepID=A0A2G5HZR7_CERBT|nr:hypothetical protein CB0940_05506 [Cercospora beticola]PIA98039.1 hypothetical protein CB0940_05506 [Cercospora beticola]WPA98060.1 hypothetical protein RHO25_002671 [Cercospora beticola]
MVTQNKSMFGPLETKHIFAAKWFRKFDKHVMTAAWKTNEGWVDWVSLGVDMTLAFKEQSAALNFDEETLSRLHIRFYQQDQHKPDNVWAAAEKLREMINWHVDDGARVMRLRGRAMPEVKVKFDDLVDKVTLAIADGLWDGGISEEALKVLEKTMKGKPHS